MSKKIAKSSKTCYMFVLFFMAAILNWSGCQLFRCIQSYFAHRQVNYHTQAKPFLSVRLSVEGDNPYFGQIYPQYHFLVTYGGSNHLRLTSQTPQSSDELLKRRDLLRYSDGFSHPRCCWRSGRRGVTVIGCDSTKMRLTNILMRKRQP